MKFGQAVAFVSDSPRVVERPGLFLLDSTYRRESTDEQLIHDTAKSVNNYLKNGFPTSTQGLQELTEVLGVRALCLDPDPNIKASDRLSLSFGQPTDKFLEKLANKLEQGSLTEIDIEKLKLLNKYLQSADQIAVDFIMADFDRKTLGELNSRIKGHQDFERKWEKGSSRLTIEDQFQLVNARGTITKLFHDSGVSEDIIKQRLSEVFNVANELISLGVKVPQMIGFLVDDGRNTVNSNLSVEERYQFLTAVMKLAEQPIPPLGLAPYVTKIFNSTEDVSGNMQEAIVAATLLKSGWNIRAISQPVYAPRTELDIIASHTGINYVIEVKTSTLTLGHKNDRNHDNQISNLLKHCDARHARLGIYCLDQPRVNTSGVIRAVNGVLQGPEDAINLFVISPDGSTYNLDGQKVA